MFWSVLASVLPLCPNASTHTFACGFYPTHATEHGGVTRVHFRHRVSRRCLILCASGYAYQEVPASEGGYQKAELESAILWALEGLGYEGEVRRWLGTSP